MERQILEVELELVTKNIWSMILGLNISRTETAGRLTTDQDEVRTSVLILGAWNGKVEISLSRTLAHQVMRAMFDGYCGELSIAHLEDALREIANVTGGNVKNALPTPTELSLPTISAGALPAPLSNAQPIVELEFESHAEPYRVRVFRS